jgi:hypothetical protein
MYYCNQKGDIMTEPPRKRYVDENGRECLVCGKYKVWVYFDRASAHPTGYHNICKHDMMVMKQQFKKIRSSSHSGSTDHQAAGDEALNEPV